MVDTSTRAAQKRAWYLANREQVLKRMKVTGAAYFKRTYKPHPRTRKEREPKLHRCWKCGTMFEVSQTTGNQRYCVPEHRPRREYRQRPRPVVVRPAPKPRIGPVWVPQATSQWERGLDRVWQA